MLGGDMTRCCYFQGFVYSRHITFYVDMCVLSYIETKHLSEARAVFVHVLVVFAQEHTTTIIVFTECGHANVAHFC